MSRTRDLTRGEPLPLIVRFSWPLVLSAFFQQLYSFVDSVIVGRFVGVDALASVNLVYPIVFILLGLTMGSALGFCVPYAQAVGAKDHASASRYFWNGLYAVVALSLLPAALAFPAATPLLRLIHMPASLLSAAASYLTIILLGQVTVIAYNFAAGIIRAHGNSRRPFHFLLLGCAVNLVADLLFIVGFGWGVAGAAWATVIGQAVSAVCAFAYLRRMRVIATVDTSGSLRTLNGPVIRRLGTVGLPMGLELAVNGIGSLILQACVNTMGAAVVAAVAAAEKIRSLITLPMEHLGAAMSTYTAQNIGAGRIDRVRGGIRAALTILIAYCITAFGLVLVLRGPLVDLLLGPAVPEISTFAERYLIVVAVFFTLHALLQVFRGVVQGMGYGMPALASGV